MFAWPNILYPVIGTLLAMLVSALPGVSGVALMAMALPFTLYWEPLPVMLLFGAFLGGATFMGSVTAILLNVPGRNSNAATMLDGYPMAQRGEARTALGCSAAASALGSTFGVAVLILLIPVLREAVLWLGPAELLVIVAWGLLTIATVSRGTPVKGLIMAGLGFLIAFVGVDPRTGEPRFTAGSVYLLDGIGFVPIFLGIFALAEALDLMASGRQTISGSTRAGDLTGSIRRGIGAVFRHFDVFLKSSVIGTVVGMLPGVGGTVASFIAYARTANSRDGQFGNGDIRGVLAPEAANDAKDGGALVPTLAFGIPGGTGTAMLLVVLTAHGLSPGQDLMTNKLSLVFVLIWSLFVSNWLTSLVGLVAAPAFTRLTVMRIDRLVPLLIVTTAIAAYIARNVWLDVVVTFLFGILGFYLKKFDWPRIPFVIALVLAPVFERNLHLTWQLHAMGRIDFWARPLTLLFIVLLGITVVVAWVRRRA